MSSFLVSVSVCCLEKEDDTLAQGVILKAGYRHDECSTDKARAVNSEYTETGNRRAETTAEFARCWSAESEDAALR